MYIAILGRQPAIGMAELERLFGDTQWFSDNSATFLADSFDIQRLGGTVKAGRVVTELPRGDWRQVSMKLVQAYVQAWATHEGKITLGISAYGFGISARDVQKTGIILKSKLKDKGVSVRLVPNDDAILGTATAHHNKLGLSGNKVELLVIRGRGGKVIIAESTGSQNITALAKRDQERPARDAFVGMLPPKLAQIMINLATHVEVNKPPFLEEDVPARASQAPQAGPQPPVERPPKENGGLFTDNSPIILDPFCGTGVLLQEAILLGYQVYGTDLSEKMIRYSRDNIHWLEEQYRMRVGWYLHEGDAMTTTWRQPIDAVACETYLGQPFSAPPSAEKLTQVRGNCDHIITTFLKNIGTQIQPGTPLCIAVPAWNDGNGNFTHLPLTKKLAQLGYQQHEFKNVNTQDLLYYREGQVVARELLVLQKM